MSDRHTRVVTRQSSKCLKALAAGLLAAATLGAGEEEASINAPPPPPPALPSLASPRAARGRVAANADPNVPSARGGAAAAAGLPQITLPPTFATLMKRSIFARNGVASGAAGRPVVAPEAAFGLRGIVFDDTSFVVFVEDTTSHRTLQLRPGDSVAGGKVGRICLDDFEYESAGTVKHVRVGQNLAGAPLPPVQAAAPAGPTTAPAEGMPPPGATPGRGPARPGGPVYEISPNGQRVRDYVAERAG